MTTTFVFVGLDLHLENHISIPFIFFKPQSSPFNIYNHVSEVPLKYLGIYHIHVVFNLLNEINDV
jgi:hypothetical protein